jgi:hypothetical protein
MDDAAREGEVRRQTEATLLNCAWALARPLRLRLVLLVGCALALLVPCGLFTWAIASTGGDGRIARAIFGTVAIVELGATVAFAFDARGFLNRWVRRSGDYPTTAGGYRLPPSDEGD